MKKDWMLTKEEGLRRGARRRLFRWWCGIWIPVPLSWIAGLGTILLLVWHIVMNPFKVYLVSRVFPVHHHSWGKLRGSLSQSSSWDLLVFLGTFLTLPAIPWKTLLCLAYIPRLLNCPDVPFCLFRISTCQPPRQYHSQRRQHFFLLLGLCETLNFKLQSWNFLSIPGDFFFLPLGLFEAPDLQPQSLDLFEAFV